MAAFSFTKAIFEDKPIDIFQVRSLHTPQHLCKPSPLSRQTLLMPKPNLVLLLPTDPGSLSLLLTHP